MNQFFSFTSASQFTAKGDAGEAPPAKQEKPSQLYDGDCTAAAIREAAISKTLVAESDSLSHGLGSHHEQ